MFLQRKNYAWHSLLWSATQTISLNFGTKSPRFPFWNNFLVILNRSFVLILAQSLYWIGIKKTIAEFVASCLDCQQSKYQARSP